MHGFFWSEGGVSTCAPYSCSNYQGARADARACGGLSLLAVTPEKVVMKSFAYRIRISLSGVFVKGGRF